MDLNGSGRKTDVNGKRNVLLSVFHLSTEKRKTDIRNAREKGAYLEKNAKKGNYLGKKQSNLKLFSLCNFIILHCCFYCYRTRHPDFLQIILKE